MPDPADLLAVARLLMNAGATPPSDAQLRRAVSTAYYALFHKILRAAAQRFMGPNQEGSAGYAILYRSFDHRHMKVICEALAVSKLKDTLKRQLGRDVVSQDMRNFAYAFPVPQDACHLADYDPQADVLVLMMVKARG